MLQDLRCSMFTYVLSFPGLPPQSVGSSPSLSDSLLLLHTCCSFTLISACFWTLWRLLSDATVFLQQPWYISWLTWVLLSICKFLVAFLCLPSSNCCVLLKPKLCHAAMLSLSGHSPAYTSSLTLHSSILFDLILSLDSWFQPPHSLQ